MRLGLDHLLVASTVVGLGLSVAVWRSGGTAPDPVVPVVDGAALFRSKGCASCHDGPGLTSMTGIAPSLRDAATWAGERKAGLSAEGYLTESIAEPGASIAPSWAAAQGPLDAMPQLGLDDAEAAAIVAFLLRG